MERNEISIRQWIENWKAGKYLATDVHTQCDAGWYDWFCKDSSLARRTAILAKKVMKIAKSSKVDQDKWYVWFKNNCPLDGKLYDDFRFADMETGDVVYTIVPRSGHTSMNGAAELWGRENDFEEALVEGTWKDILAYFDVK